MCVAHQVQGLPDLVDFDLDASRVDLDSQHSSLYKFKGDVHI